MAIVRYEYTSWPGHTGQGSDIGSLLVWHNDTGQRRIDRVEIDNQACTDQVRVIVRDDNAQQTVLFDQTVAPGALFTYTPPTPVSWNRNTQTKVGQWSVTTVTSTA